ncbi:hypothetical protein [Paenibacillus larvae]|uniref:DUF3221 domain-containing protein n=1 Tax=Paenibacillus larvae subsp. larvae DSM 25430 TaxID=697284 RepID=V9WB99_9BACL|nr:hypothetical protein [Paenibacillus larvae]AHD06392.1 hypothetical protein ERIC2_c26050 [Paenibacillus larvae subsp. larvae DSM 25430]AVG12938.1 hypothetical protein ERICII_02584 [Paenibacillus larvae subsp. larvae DSM 25430]MDR5569060.1 DUF3221 domain-containing protein [Paenibacillus larvae]MDR5596664.1 DUF3221 domain-containing protein [Paenibacillus larvae]
MITKKTLVAVATFLTLGLGFAAGATPTFAHSDDTLNPSVSSVEKQDQIQLTGYIRSFDHGYALIIVAPTQEEALQGDWEDLIDQGKLVVVPVPVLGTYAIGDKVDLVYQSTHFQIE